MKSQRVQAGTRPVILGWLQVSSASVVLGIAAAAMWTSAMAADPVAAPRQFLRARHVPDAVASGQARVVAPVDLQRRLRVAVHLPSRNQSELTQLLQDLYDPASARYHKYLGVEEFTARFGPAPEDYQAVVSWATANGLSVVSTTPNRRLVAVEGPVGTLNRALGVVMTNYQHPGEARVFYSPDREPTVSGLKVPLLQITGMSDFMLPRPMLQRAPAAEANTAAVANTAAGSGPNGQYLPSDLRAVYYGNGPLTGAGQSIGIVSAVGYRSSDVQLFYSSTGMSSSVPIVNRPVANWTDACNTSPVCNDGEPVLDIVNAIGMAPGIAQILVYEGGGSTEILNLMATDNIAKVLSCSWGFGAGDAAADDPIFQEFAAQGQSFVQASGDSGQYTSSWGYLTADPYTTVAGGTSLTTSVPGPTWSGEVAWSHSGGGYIHGFPIPSWQPLPGVINASNQGSTTLRNVPDVAAEADYDNVTVVNGRFQSGWGGTSFAAPRWAGFLALVNQQSVANGNQTVGFINPTLYGLGVGPNPGSYFHDITSGTNGFPAVPGYDLVTGWGSPTGSDLIDALAGSPLPSPVTSYITSTGEQHWAYLASNQHLVNLGWSPNSGYTGADDVTAILGAPAASGGALSAYVTASGEQHWAYFGPNQHLYNLWWSPASGYVEADDVTVVLNAPLAADGRRQLTTFVTGSGEQHWAYFDANQHVWNLWWSPSTGYTGVSDMTAALSAPPALSGSALVSYVTASGEQHWAYLASNLHLYNLAWSGSTGHADDVTAAVGAPPAWAASALTSFVASSGEQHWGYLDSNQHLYHLWWAPSTGYTGGDDVTAMANLPAATAEESSLTSFWMAGIAQNWAYLDSNQHLEMVLGLTGGGLFTSIYVGGDITASVSAPPARPGSALTSFRTPSGDQHWAYFDSSHHLYNIWFTNSPPPNTGADDVTAILHAPPSQ